MANVGRRDRLVTYEDGRLNWLDPESETERVLLAVTSNLNLPRKGEIPHVDIIQDVNADDRDDLVVPEIDGLWKFVQMSDGDFDAPVKISTSTDMSEIYEDDGYRHISWGQSRVHEMDYKMISAIWCYGTQTTSKIHLQDAHGLFAPTTKTFTTDMEFDSDDLDSLTTGDMMEKVLYSLTDMNGDGVADPLVFPLESRKISSKRSIYEVHFGTPTPDDGTLFAPEIGTAFKSDGSIQLRMDRHDFDRDGQVDLMFMTTDLNFLQSNLWKSIKEFMGDDIWLEIEL